MAYKEKQCIVCGKLFIPSSSRQICCGEECLKKHNKERKKEYNKQHYIKNKEHKKQYYEKNREHYKELRKQWYQQNKEHIREYMKEWRDGHKEHIKKYEKQYYEKNREHYKELHKQWRENNKEYWNEYMRQHRCTDLNYRMSHWCRKQLYRCLYSKKTEHTFDILDYTPDELKLHIQSQFKEDMSWDNHGTLWHIDHIKPICLFNFLNEDGTPNYGVVREANSLDNLQPLYIEENLSKGGYYDEAC